MQNLVSEKVSLLHNRKLNYHTWLDLIRIFFTSNNKFPSTKFTRDPFTSLKLIECYCSSVEGSISLIKNYANKLHGIKNNLIFNFLKQWKGAYKFHINLFVGITGIIINKLWSNYCSSCLLKPFEDCWSVSTTPLCSLQNATKL